jgi:peptide/nickel transport system permease protein
VLRYVIRRLLWIVVLLLLVSAITFVVFYVLPSADPAALRAGRQADPQLIQQIRHQLGLDDPIYVQYFDYMRGIVLHFDFGFSYENNTPVRELIFDRLPATVSLALGAAVIWLVSGVAVGIVSAVRRGSLLDRAAMGGALLAVSAPVYWLGLITLYLFSLDIGRFPVLPGSGAYAPLTQDPGQWFTSLLMPWLVLSASFAAIYARLLRANLLDVLSKDYIRTARAKGLTERTVVLKHGMRSAITPIVTVLGIDLGVLLGGVILTETVFNIPGIGRLSYDAITRSDLPVIQGTVLLGAFFIVALTLVVDIVYAFLDPRVRYA